MIKIDQYLINFELVSILATPILSFIAIIIYARALQNSRFQNEVLLSQNLKINFEKGIKALLKNGKDYGHFINGKSFNHLDILKAISYHMRTLTNSEEFQIDRAQKKNISEIYLKKRNYEKDLYWIRYIINQHSSSTLYYKRIENFLDNVDDSRMIKEDKYFIKNKLHQKILKKPLKIYHLFFLNLRLNQLDLPIFTLEKHKLEWQKLEDSPLFKSIEKIKNVTTKG